MLNLDDGDILLFIHLAPFTLNDIQLLRTLSNHFENHDFSLWIQGSALVKSNIQAPPKNKQSRDSMCECVGNRGGAWVSVCGQENY